MWTGNSSAILRGINNYFHSAAKSLLLLLSLLILLILGFVDYITGEEISFSLFYIIPISLVTWYISMRAGLLTSICAAAIWFIADLKTGHSYSHFLVPIWNSTVRLVFFIIVSSLLSIIKQKLETEERLAGIDYLTGLKNSRAFYELVEIESDRSRRYKRPFTIAYIDLDNFKYLNDTQGHEAGDEALKIISETIKHNVRHLDIISRLGGDEFAIFFPETDFTAAELTIKKIQPMLMAAMKNSNWPITFSIGFITFVKPLATVREMIKMADDLMYSIKKSGKNNIIHKQSG